MADHRDIYGEQVEMISISKFEYDDLKYNSCRLGFLADALRENARLDYDKKGLRFDGIYLESSVKLLMLHFYQETLKKLLEMEGDKE